MIGRALFLALCGSAATLGTLHLARVDPTAGPPATPTLYHELPLAGVPVIRDGQLRGLSFARIGVVADAGVEPSVLETFVADALHDATLGQPNGVEAAVPHLVSGDLLRTALPLRLKRAGAPFDVSRVVLLQAEHRSPDRLRALARDRVRDRTRDRAE